MRVEREGGRAGLGLAEVLVLGAIVGLIILMLMASLPRRREAARAVACRENLRQIGQAITLYAEAERVLPGVPVPGPIDAPARPGPLAETRSALGVEDFLGLGDPDRPPARKSIGAITDAGPVPGFTCPSDPGATSGRFASPVSYRAVAGDAPEGLNGPFAPGRRLTSAAAEAADGLAYTAAFGERLVGGGKGSAVAPGDYAVLPGPIPATGVLAIPSADAWRGDAGSSWAVADWRSTLLNHALPPGGGPSALAADGKSARMGASSGHGGFVNVLMLDGSVQPFAYKTEGKVWRRLANVNDEVAAAAPPSAVAPVPRP